MADVLRVPAERVRAQIEAVLGAWGMPERQRRETAEVMVETDLRGIDSHGISMLILYDQMQAAGQLALAAEARIVRQTVTTALVDGGAGLGHPAALMAMRLAIEKARAHDLAAVSVFNSHHFGAAGIYAEMAAKADLIGIVMSTSRIVNVVPTHAAERVLGTNPIAIAAPAGHRPPFLLDMSTSVVAANKVKMHALDGKPIPEGWVVDGRGNRITASDVAYDLLFNGGDGGLTPAGGGGTTLGGHKGYGLGIAVQIMAGALGGGSFSYLRNRTQRRSAPDNIGHLFIALNPAALRPIEDYRKDVDAVIDSLREARPAAVERPVLIPGDPERLTRERRLLEGIPIARQFRLELEAITSRAGVDLLLA